jgi:hypothetical protein
VNTLRNFWIPIIEEIYRKIEWPFASYECLCFMELIWKSLNHIKSYHMRSRSSSTGHSLFPTIPNPGAGHQHALAVWIIWKGCSHVRSFSIDWNGYVYWNIGVFIVTHPTLSLSTAQSVLLLKKHASRRTSSLASSIIRNRYVTGPSMFSTVM